LCVADGKVVEDVGRSDHVAEEIHPEEVGPGVAARRIEDQEPSGGDNGQLAKVLGPYNVARVQVQLPEEGYKRGDHKWEQERLQEQPERPLPPLSSLLNHVSMKCHQG